MNLAELAEQSAERLGERKSLVFEGRGYTNWEQLERARRIQRGLEGLGLGRGDVVALCMSNHPTVYPVFQAIFRSGATAVPVMFQLAAAQLRYVLADTRATGVVTDAANLMKTREAVVDLDHVRWIAVSEGDERSDAHPREYRLETLAEEEAQFELPGIRDDDVALILYTSGTTGKPKGAMLTHANLVASATASNDASELHLWTEPRISVSAMPMAHIFGIGVMNGSYLLPEALADSYTVQMTWFEPKEFMRLIQEHKANVIPSVPTMLSLILNHPEAEEFDLSSLKEVICGAAPLPVELARAFERRHGCRVREIYGMTENAGIATANRRSRTYKAGSAGYAYRGVEVEIRDDAGNFLPPGERGEIVTRGPSTMKGYWNRPDATAETIREGWLHTGDIGTMDDEGYVFIVDRKKDMIIRGGENIYPAEVEEALYAHPAVAEAAVVGAPDAVYGEMVIAFVVPKSGSSPAAGELIDHVAKAISKFKAPSRVHMIDALPKSPVGKVLRRELRTIAAEGVSTPR